MASSLDTCRNCVFRARTVNTLLSAEKLQSRHYLIELCGRDTPRSQQDIYDSTCAEQMKPFPRTVDL